MSELTLTAGQQNAYEAFVDYIMDPLETVFVLEGYSGTGKTTLVQTLLDRLPKILSACKTIGDGDGPRWDLMLTATTNKAAEAFSYITGADVRTIHNALGLRVHKDYSTGKTSLIARSNAEPLEDTILVIDEASYIDRDLLQLIFERTIKCKIIFIGDPAQLLTVGCLKAPVFNSNFKTAKLTEVVRQTEGNPIIELATSFRDTVNEGEFFSFKPDGVNIQYLSREQFEEAIITEFDDPTWTHNRSKVLAWTNKTVIRYNHAIRDYVKGAPNFHTDDYAICNKYVSNGKKCSMKTDQLAHITDIGEDTIQLGVVGNIFTLDNVNQAFMPQLVDDKKVRLSEAKKEKDYTAARVIEETWIDLRAAYACTAHKSQGSTYNTVFIDLDDFAKCNSGNAIARMLYVAVSRARNYVILTGDLI